MSISSDSKNNKYIPTQYWGRLGYISEADAENITNFKYHGSDSSLIYKYITSPAAELLLKFTPSYLAPNLITLFGFILPFSAHILLVLNYPYFSGNINKYISIWAGVSMILYSILDVLDGKQARKISAGSPLGLLFDHGCDCLNSQFSALSLAIELQLGAQHVSEIGSIGGSSVALAKVFTIWAGAVAGFFFGTWEEYFTGELALPFINGANEGLFMVAFLHLFTAIVTPEFWFNILTLPEISFLNNGEPIQIQYNSIFLIFSGLIVLEAVVANVYRVIRVIITNTSRFKSNKPPTLDSVPKQSSTSIKIALTRLAPILTLCILFYTILYIISYKLTPGNYFWDNIILIYWTLTLLIARMTMQLMLAHVARSEFHPNTKTISITIVILAHCILLALFTKNIDPKIYYFVTYELFALALYSYLHFIISILTSLTRILDINVLTVKKKKNL